MALGFTPIAPRPAAAQAATIEGRIVDQQSAAVPGATVTAVDSRTGFTVSRRHARVLLTSAAAILEDLGSKNGTRVNGVMVRGATALADGDEIQVGAHQLVFRTRAYRSTKTEAGAARTGGARTKSERRSPVT